MDELRRKVRIFALYTRLFILILQFVCSMGTRNRTNLLGASSGSLLCRILSDVLPTTSGTVVNPQLGSSSGLPSSPFPLSQFNWCSFSSVESKNGFSQFEHRTNFELKWYHRKLVTKSFSQNFSKNLLSMSLNMIFQLIKTMKFFGTPINGFEWTRIFFGRV